VNTNGVSKEQIFDHQRTIPLNGIMSNPAQHRELRVPIQPKPLPHPREEMSQAVMSTLDTLRYSCAARCEAECRRRVGTEDDASRCL